MHANDYPLPEPATWRDRAACAGHDVTVFYPGRHGSEKTAKAICADRPVQVDCLTDALAEEAAAVDARPFGIRGGTTARERIRITQKRKGHR